MAVFRNLLGCLALLGLCALAPPGAAQTADSVFRSYEDLRSFVDTRLMRRDFIPVIQTLGGRDEYTPEELAQINAQFLSLYPQNLETAGLVRKRQGENGFSQEVISYWLGTSYLWLYLFLHDTGDGVVVVNFSINSNAKPILDQM